MTFNFTYAQVAIGLQLQ